MNVRQNHRLSTLQRIGLVALGIPLFALGLAALFGVVLSFNLYPHRFSLLIMSVFLFGFGAVCFATLGGGLIRAALFKSR